MCSTLSDSGNNHMLPSTLTGTQIGCACRAHIALGELERNGDEHAVPAG